MYLIRPRGRLDISTLVNSWMLDSFSFFPSYPDTSFALQVEDGNSMLYVRDPTMQSLKSFIASCDDFGLPVRLRGDDLSPLAAIKLLERAQGNRR